MSFRLFRKKRSTLIESDVEDMFFDTYCLPESAPRYMEDAGRSRSEALYKKMYGSSETAV